MRPFSVSIALLLLLAGAPARAQWSASASTNLNISGSTSLSGIPGIFPDHAGGAVLAWGDGRGTCVQRLDAFGNKIWGASGTVISPTNLTATPRSISDDAGGLIVGWSETAVSHTGFFVQRVTRTSAQAWTANGVNVTPAGNVFGMCSDGAGGVIVGWTMTVGSLVNMYVNRVTAAGVLSWGASGKLIYSSGDLKVADMIVPSTGSGAILGWHNYLVANLSDPDTLFFQRVDGSGNPQWPTPGSPSFVRVVTLDDTAVQWSCVGPSSSAYFTTQRADSLYLHRLQTTGVFASPVVGWPIAGPTTAKVKISVDNPMIPDGTGGVVVAWRDESYGGSIFGRVRAQRLNSAGTRLWPTSGGTFVQVCTASNDEGFPGMTLDGYGNVVMGWEDYRNAVNINLWAMKLDIATGAQLWASTGVVFASATDNQFWPQFAPGNPGNVIAAFDDARTGQEKLYAQFLGPAGALTPTNNVVFTTVTQVPAARGASGYATDGTKLYVEGGGGVGGAVTSNTVSNYLPGTDTWATPVGTYLARWFGSLAYLPGTNKLYALNGNDNISAYWSQVEEIPVTGGAATLKATNPVPREAAGTAVANGRIYVIGGNQDPAGLLNDVRTFDPLGGPGAAWSPALAALPVARAGLTATTYNGAIYAFGGQDALGLSKQLDRYDLTTGTWSTLTAAPLAMNYHASAVTGGLLWFAGNTALGWTLLSYAPATDTWTVHTTNLLSRRFAAAAGIGNTLVVTGGAFGSPSQDNLDTQVADVSALVAATPLAAASLPVGATGAVNFATLDDTTNVTLDFGSIAGPGTAAVSRYPGPPANVSFSSVTPSQVGPTRWVMSESGLSPFTATVYFQLYGLSDPLGPGNGIVIYKRSTPGSGAFDPLPTTYDPVTGRVSATVTGFSEFVLGSGGTAGVPTEPGLALAVRPLGPNPVRGAPSFRLSLPGAGAARLELFDVQGRLVAARDLLLPAGAHTVRLAGDRTPGAGLYFARLTQAGSVARTRIVITP